MVFYGLQYSKNLNDIQKKDLGDFLEEFQNVFSRDIVAGSCDVLKHEIDIKDSFPIKQVPRRVSLHMRGEVNKIIKDMKEQGVIEESQSP